MAQAPKGACSPFRVAFAPCGAAGEDIRAARKSLIGYADAYGDSADALVRRTVRGT
jgi:hypothetical protein